IRYLISLNPFSIVFFMWGSLLELGVIREVHSKTRVGGLGGINPPIKELFSDQENSFLCLFFIKSNNFKSCFLSIWLKMNRSILDKLSI
ncbi:MAG: hypothetical protein AB4063_03810, partial [Crocosphaera sp.]